MQERRNSSALAMELPYVFLALTHRYQKYLCFILSWVQNNGIYNMLLQEIDALQPLQITWQYIYIACVQMVCYEMNKYAFHHVKDSLAQNKSDNFNLCIYN